MHNIGGIIQCEILAADDIAAFSVNNHTIQIKKKGSAEWKSLPISIPKTSVIVTPTAGNAGTLYEHIFNTTLPMNRVTVHQANEYRRLCISGCILRYTDANGLKRIIGTKEYPLTGTLAEAPGSTAAVLAGYTLSLKASELTPQLPYQDK